MENIIVRLCRLFLINLGFINSCNDNLIDNLENYRKIKQKLSTEIFYADKTFEKQKFFDCSKTQN